MLQELDKQHEYPANGHPIITDTDSRVDFEVPEDYIYNISLQDINLLL